MQIKRKNSSVLAKIRPYSLKFVRIHEITSFLPFSILAVINTLSNLSE